MNKIKKWKTEIAQVSKVDADSPKSAQNEMEGFCLGISLVQEVII